MTVNNSPETRARECIVQSVTSINKLTDRDAMEINVETGYSASTLVSSLGIIGIKARVMSEDKVIIIGKDEVKKATECPELLYRP